MTNNAKPVAKSLHTITVIQQIAQLHRENALLAGNHYSKAMAVQCAMETLGLANRPDPYGLADKALRLMGGK